MLTFYYHPLSPIALRVWLALLEKGIEFEEKIVDIPGGAQRRSPFTETNPFGHVPVIEDGDLRLIESLAILDYLELKYPEHPLSPKEPEAIASMKMIELVTTNELLPILPSLITQQSTQLSKNAQQRLDNVLNFFEEHLRDQKYFGGDRLNLADIVAGSAVLLMMRLGLTLDDYPALKAWGDRLANRPAWQQTRSSDENFEAWRAWLEKYLRIANKMKQRSAK